MRAKLAEKIAMSIERIKNFEPDDGYFVAYSGGKDSTVLLELVRRAGVKFDVHYSVTTVDPPELVRFIRSQFGTIIYAYKDGRQKTIKSEGEPTIYFDLPETPMRKLIPKKKTPPTRIARYCCAELKESSGVGRVTMTGVRWAESVNRKNTHGVVGIQGKSKTTKALAERMGANFNLNRHGDVILNDDNDENRRMVEHCYRTQKTIVNPIVDWTDDDVWEFIKGEGIPYCELYDKGHDRLGCVGCPLGGFAGMRRELAEYPAIKRMYTAAFKEMLEVRKAAGKNDAIGFWKDADAVMYWWIGGFKDVVNGQVSCYDILDGVDVEDDTE